MQKPLLYASTGIFVAMLGLAWVTHGTGVVRNDIERNIYIPDELTMSLQVQAAYNGRDMFFRYRWPTRQPSIYHDMLRYEGGKWVRYGASVPGPQAQGIYEDRVAMLVDDGSVPEFARYGGYITVGDRMRFFTDEATADEVGAHPYLGLQRGQSEVGKHLPATRRNIDDWSSVVPENELTALRDAGYFLDLWHWRAHRSNPIDASDDQFVFDARYGDAGNGPFTTNWDAETSQPRFMFDPDKTGRHALAWDDLAGHELGFDDLYYITEETAVPFDPGHAWQDGDTIPRRLLRAGEGSRFDIQVAGQGRWQDGWWDVTLQRAMDTGNPLDDKAFVDRGSYIVAFAVHRNSFGSRWHYVSLPFSLGLAREAEIIAEPFTGTTPDWNQPITEVTLFYPGQVSWPHVNSAQHAGSQQVKEGVPVRFRHSEAQLAHYGVEAEFREPIGRQWWLTMAAGLLLIGGFGVSLNRLISRKQGD